MSERLDEADGISNEPRNSTDDVHENQEETVLIHGLPNEILLHVFSFLSTLDVYRNVALTCKRWWRVSKSPSLLVDLCFGPRQPTEVVLRVLQGAPMLKWLSLYTRHDANDLIREAASSNLKLVRLKIAASKEGRHADLDADVILEFLRNCRHLRYLVLKRVSFDNPEVAYRELGPAAPQLLGLNVNHSVQLDTALLHDLVFGLPKLRDLRAYCLSYNRIGSVTPYTDTPIMEMLMKMGDTLECLKINMLGVTDGIMPLLSSLPCLKILHLYRLVNVQDEAFILISRLSSLRKLVVTVPRAISADCWRQLFGSPELGLLTLITISNSYSLEDQALRVIADNCPDLTDISIPGCRRVTDVGITHLILGCRRLTRMNLFSTRSVVSQAFIIIPHYLPNMELLIYKPVDSSTVVLPQELEQMPNLTIKSVYRYM